jgi:hypothetical protein
LPLSFVNGYCELLDPPVGGAPAVGQLHATDPAPGAVADLGVMAGSANGDHDADSGLK